jgi:hypothetical protein
VAAPLKFALHLLPRRPTWIGRGERRAVDVDDFTGCAISRITLSAAAGIDGSL